MWFMRDTESCTLTALGPVVLPWALVHTVLALRFCPGSVSLQLPVWVLLSHLEVLAPPRATGRSWGVECGHEGLRPISYFRFKFPVLNWASLHPVNFCKITILCTSSRWKGG